MHPRSRTIKWHFAIFSHGECPVTGHAPPLWVHKRDGRVVAFNADKIARALFAASEGLGRPDAFLARELTDGVVHFLAEQTNGAPPQAQELSDLVAKVVRELGQPALARSFCEFTPKNKAKSKTLAACTQTDAGAWTRLAQSAAPAHVLAQAAAAERLCELSLAEVYPRDLVSLHRDGLLTLTGLQHPFELSATVLGPGGRPLTPGQGLLETLEAAREHTGDCVSLDGPEHALAALDGEPSALAAEFTRELRAGLRSTGLSAVVNLNHPLPPPWARALGDGPLFASLQRGVDDRRRGDITAALLSQLLSLPAVTVAWHVGPVDVDPERRAQLQDLARRSMAGQELEFVFNRPRKPVVLGAGLTRERPARLVAVGVNMPRLASQITEPTLEKFLAKLGTLARLARSAGYAKQDFLRRRGRPALRSAFLLERACLAVVPGGLEDVVRTLTGRRLGDGGAAVDFGAAILRQLRSDLASEKSRIMEVCVEFEALIIQELPPAVASSAAPPDSCPRSQLQTYGQLHTAAGGGCAWIVGPALSPAAAQPAEVVVHAFTQTEVGRLRLRPSLPEKQQLAAPWTHATEM